MQAEFKAETEILHRVASNPDCWFRWTDHAEKRMAQYGRTADDVICALINGQVTRVDVKEDIIYRVKGKDIDGAPLEVAAAVFERTITIKVVTVI
jgi:hypothetical protein